MTNREKYKKLYDVKVPVEEKIDRIVKDIFKASKVNYSDQAKSILDSLKDNNLDKLPVVIFYIR